MKTYNLLLVALFVIYSSCISQNNKINGVSFVAARDSITKQHISPVINFNSNFVALMPYGFVRELSSPTIIHNTERQWFGETENGLLQYAKEFKKAKIGIMVKPHIWIWKGEFTGNMKMSSEENWQKLEKSYTSFILTYAKAAEKIGAAVFCIGTELEQFVLNRPQFWKKLIANIKEVYKGKLTYAANWDEFKRVTFWEELDYIGIDAYFPLSDKEKPTVIDLENGWQKHKTEIIRVQQKYQKKIIFTEFGYRSVNYTAKEPWNSGRIEGNVNLQAQSNGLQAIYNQFWDEEWFAGGFVWKWFHKHEKVGGDSNNRFTPQNKPAQKLLKELYKN
ncbi:glycoside hydrolase family 113 [Polaribacter tangerinus]|uniref:glycoside hydrolase family 113 n=1 Tax=Polaribacter tangerinus TaxID=1920034 RepID=UPI000B4B9804|nr:glycoside hydrolase TIM-barrel-like domain-containing protein [Polaribacter tangerinus]